MTLAPHWETRLDGKRLAAVAVSIALIATVTALLIRWRNRNRPKAGYVKTSYERELGERTGLLTRRMLPPAGRVGVLTLFPVRPGPYAERVEALRAALDKEFQFVGVLDAQTSGHYSDDDYALSIDAALRDFSPLDALVILSAGSFTHARVSSALYEFLKAGGKLVMVGQIGDPGSPLVALVPRGKAAIIARHAGPLASLRRSSETESAPNAAEFFRRHYSVIEASNWADFRTLLEPAR